jgi:hypothetical protein
MDGHTTHNFFSGIAMAGVTRANREIAGHFLFINSGGSRAPLLGGFGAHFPKITRQTQ